MLAHDFEYASFEYYIAGKKPIEMDSAVKELRQMGAIAANAATVTLTDKGRNMAKFPVHPKLSAMLSSARCGGAEYCRDSMQWSVFRGMQK